MHVTWLVVHVDGLIHACVWTQPMPMNSCIRHHAPAHIPPHTLSPIAIHRKDADPTRADPSARNLTGRTPARQTRIVVLMGGSSGHASSHIVVEAHAAGQPS